MASAQEGGKGFLKIKANRGNAGIFVDNQYLGPASNFGMTRKYTISAGEHDLTLRDPRYQDFSTKVKIEPGKTTTISESLQAIPVPHPPFGTLRVEGGSSKFCAVYLNGKFVGHVDEFSNFTQGILVNPGEFTMTVVSPGGKQEFEQKVSIEANRTTRVRVGSAG